jgi:hypothetical protein
MVMKKIYFILFAGLFAFTPLRIQTSTAQNLPFTQNWSNTGLITLDDTWTGVPGVQGFRGDAMVGGTAVDPQTVLADGSATPLDVNANRSDPNTFTTGGIAEFDGIANPVVALQGSGTARAPHLVIYLNTTSLQNINVAYNLRDIDGSADNSVQAVALQFRVGNTGNFTNVPAGFVADATTGPSLATLVTPVSTGLPAACNNQPEIQVRIITTDAIGSDEWIGIDDIVISGQAMIPTPISLNNFSGYKQGNMNLLSWSTAAEINNNGFEVQRSSNGINYAAIGFVNSQAIGGNSTTQLNYAFTDNSGTGSRQYYRLRQVDIDGHSKLSNIVLIKGDKPLTLTIDGLFPNPASSVVNVLIAAPNKDKATLIITDITGRVVIRQALNVETGSSTIQVDINRLTKGDYMLKLVCSSNCESTVSKFVKQ